MELWVEVVVLARQDHISPGPMAHPQPGNLECFGGWMVVARLSLLCRWDLCLMLLLGLCE